MSQENINKILRNRREFVQHLNNDLTKIESSIDSTLDKLKQLRLTSENVQELGGKVQHEAIIPLGKRIYVNANIIHTGEYFLDKLAFPDSYTVVDTLGKTLEHLDYKISVEEETLRKCDNVKKQLQERMEFFQVNSNIVQDEIYSDKGVAVKMGEFYEIFEYDEK